jgi:hypothetical protein
MSCSQSEALIAERTLPRRLARKGAAPLNEALSPVATAPAI